MKQSSTLFLKFVLAVMAGTVVLLSGFVIPEWSSQIVASDPSLAPLRVPFLSCVYLAAIPFFFALFQAYKLLSYIDANTSFAHHTVVALKRIKYSAVAIIIIMMLGELSVLMLIQGTKTQIMSLGLLVSFGSLIVATFAAVLQKLIHNGIEIQSENELTV